MVSLAVPLPEPVSVADKDRIAAVETVAAGKAAELAVAGMRAAGKPVEADKELAAADRAPVAADTPAAESSVAAAVLMAATVDTVAVARTVVDKPAGAADMAVVAVVATAAAADMAVAAIDTPAAAEAVGTVEAASPDVAAQGLAAPAVHQTRPAHLTSFATFESAIRYRLDSPCQKLPVLNARHGHRSHAPDMLNQTRVAPTSPREDHPVRLAPAKAQPAHIPSQIPGPVASESPSMEGPAGRAYQTQELIAQAAAAMLVVRAPPLQLEHQRALATDQSPSKPASTATKPATRLHARAAMQSPVSQPERQRKKCESFLPIFSLVQQIVRKMATNSQTRLQPQRIFLKLRRQCFFW